jgi:hypothetical protein
VIRVGAGMSTTRFCQKFDMPERSWRRWQAKARAGDPPKGPWPRPARSAARELAVKHALAHPVWGHRKIWAMLRHHGHVVSEATILRLLRDEGLILAVGWGGTLRHLELQTGLRNLTQFFGIPDWIRDADGATGRRRSPVRLRRSKSCRCRTPRDTLTTRCPPASTTAGTPLGVTHAMSASVARSKPTSITRSFAPTPRAGR